MANGDRLFGPNGCSGAVTGTGANIFVQLDFAPQWVELFNTANGASLSWNREMASGTGMLFVGGGGGTTGSTIATNSASAVTGTGVGTANGQSLSAEISGVGTTAVGQVITTTDNQTCALDQFRGKWLVQATATTPPNLILSNTAAAAAPVSFTVQGVANTDAGAYDVLSNAASAVTVSSLTATAAAQVQVGHTHPFAGSGGGSFIVVGGITQGSNGFTIGTDATINILGNNIIWNAGR